MRCHSIDLRGSFLLGDDFRLGSVGDVLRRWIPRPSDDHSGCRVCSVHQSLIV